MTYVSTERLMEIAGDMQSCFLVGHLHSRSSKNEIALAAKQYLQDDGLPSRPSVCYLVANYARLIWLGQIQQVKNELATQK